LKAVGAVSDLRIEIEIVAEYRQLVFNFFTHLLLPAQTRERISPNGIEIPVAVIIIIIVYKTEIIDTGIKSKIQFVVFVDDEICLGIDVTKIISVLADLIFRDQFCNLVNIRTPRTYDE
jgi:hypothetical protein